MLTKKFPPWHDSSPNWPWHCYVKCFFCFLVIVYNPMVHSSTNSGHTFIVKCNRTLTPSAPREHLCQAGLLHLDNSFQCCTVIYEHIASKWNGIMSRIGSVSSKWHWIMANSFGSITSKRNGVMIGIGRIAWKSEWSMARIGRVLAKWHGIENLLHHIRVVEQNHGKDWQHCIKVEMTYGMIFIRTVWSTDTEEKLTTITGIQKYQQSQNKMTLNWVLGCKVPFCILSSILALYPYHHITSEELQYWNWLAIAPPTRMVCTLHGDTLAGLCRTDQRVRVRLAV